MEIVDREAIFTGTVAIFLGLADAFDARRYSEGVLRIHDTRVKIWPAGQAPGHDGFIDCVELPENRTLLVCWAAPEDWPTIEPYWQELIAELRRLGCIEDAPAAVTGPGAEPAGSPARRSSLTPEKEAQARELAARDDLSWDEIGREVGMDGDHLRKVLNAPPRKPGRKPGK